MHTKVTYNFYFCLMFSANLSNGWTFTGRQVTCYLFELDDVLVHDPGPVGREQQDGGHDEDDVLVRPPARVEAADEGLVRAVDVALRQLQHVRADAAELLLAVRDLTA